MIYGTWSTGFRPGGVNRRGTLPPYESDFLTNYEIGWKTTWLNNRIRFNGALFAQEWKDFQYSVLGVNGLTDIRNAGGANIEGVEADISWAATDALTFIGSATFLSTETTQDICDSDAITGLPDCIGRLRSRAGSELPVTPEFKANFTARYEFTLGSWDAFVQGALVHQSDSGVDLRAQEAAIVGRLPSYTTFDLSSGIAFGDYTLDIYFDNVFDERAISTRYTECAIAIVPAAPDAPVPICGLQPYDIPNQPRTIGVRFGQRF